MTNLARQHNKILILKCEEINSVRACTIDSKSISVQSQIEEVIRDYYGADWKGEMIWKTLLELKAGCHNWTLEWIKTV